MINNPSDLYNPNGLYLTGTALKMNGYELIAAGRWGDFIDQYAFSMILTFTITLILIHCYKLILIEHFKKKCQKKIVESLPGVYK